MKAEELAGRIISSELSIKSRELKLGRLSQKEWELTDIYTKKLESSRGTIQDAANMDLDKIKADAKHHRLKYGGLCGSK